MSFVPEKYLVTAGGKIKCVRCKAFLKKHGRQCLSPAINKKTSLCKWHGGKSTGPKTKEGIERIRQAHLQSGNETLAAKQSRSEQSLRLQMLEQALYLLNMANGPRSRGRKAKGFKTIKSINEVKKVLDKY
jgi:hypothetical protein